MRSNIDDSRRVVFTGIGAVTPIGHTATESWNNLLAGQSGVGIIEQFDTAMLPVSVGAEVSDWDPLKYMPRQEVRRNDRFSQFSAVAAKEAIEHSGIDLADEDGDRVGLVLGNCIGGLRGIEESEQKIVESGRVRLSPFFVTTMMPNIAAGNLAIKHGLTGPMLTISTACASGTDSIGVAATQILAGRADMMISGGVESIFTNVVMGALASAKALSLNPDPATASRPFDLHRDGMVLGEGAGIVVMESLAHAKKRGANIIAELTGFWNSSDGYDMTAPNAAGQVNCMRHVLNEAQLNPEQIDYVNFHGTSTPMGDKTETESVKQVLGQHAYKIPVSSTKGATGHMLGASGSIEAIFCLNAIQHQVAPPTINLRVPDPECDLDYVPDEAREVKIDHVLSNSFGFGSQNSSIVVSKFYG